MQDRITIIVLLKLRYIDIKINIWQYICIYEHVIYIIPALQKKHVIKAVEPIWDTCICIAAIHGPWFFRGILNGKTPSP